MLFNSGMERSGIIAKENWRIEMKEYKLVYLNKKANFSREKDLEQAEGVLNKYISDGWILQQVVSPSDGLGALIAVLYREQIVYVFEDE